MAVTPRERKLLLNRLNQQANSDLRALWYGAAGLANEDFADFIVDAFPEIVDPYVALSSDMAATWYELASPASQYVAITAPPIPLERLTKSAQWALGALGDMGLDRLSGTLQRAVFDGARSTTAANVENEEGARWARYASANACEFCALLAVRGAVYTSEETAGDQYHDHCSCIAVEVRPGKSYTPPAYVKDWEDQYKKAWDKVPDGTAYDKNNSVLKAVLSEWRQLDK